MGSEATGLDQEPLLQAEEIGSLGNGHAPHPSMGQRGIFILVSLLCPGMWEGRAPAAGQEGGSVALWRERQAKYPSGVSLQTYVSILDRLPFCSCPLSGLAGQQSSGCPNVNSPHGLAISKSDIP